MLELLIRSIIPYCNNLIVLEKLQLIVEQCINRWKQRFLDNQSSLDQDDFPLNSVILNEIIF